MSDYWCNVSLFSVQFYPIWYRNTLSSPYALHYLLNACMYTKYVYTRSTIPWWDGHRMLRLENFMASFLLCNSSFSHNYSFRDSTCWTLSKICTLWQCTVLWGYSLCQIVLYKSDLLLSSLKLLQHSPGHQSNTDMKVRLVRCWHFTPSQLVRLRKTRDTFISQNTDLSTERFVFDVQTSCGWLVILPDTLFFLLCNPNDMKNKLMNKPEHIYRI